MRIEPPWARREPRPASAEDLAYLERAGYPESVIEHCRSAEPANTDVNGIRIYPISDMRAENEDAYPGCTIRRLGYLNIASTEAGDVYCLDLNCRDKQGEPAVVLVSHDLDYEEDAHANLKKGVVPIAGSFAEFLRRLEKGNLPTEYWNTVEGRQQR